MSWINPPQSVINYRDALIASATVQASILNGLTLPQQQARFHYPKADPHPTGDTFPLFVLRRQRRRARRLDSGGTFGNGTVIALLYFTQANPDTGPDDGTIEGWADGICDDITSQTTADILFVTDAEAGECVEASPAMLAAAITGAPGEAGSSFRAISITADWEG